MWAKSFDLKHGFTNVVCTHFATAQTMFLQWKLEIRKQISDSVDTKESVYDLNVSRRTKLIKSFCSTKPAKWYKFYEFSGALCVHRQGICCHEVWNVGEFVQLDTAGLMFVEGFFKIKCI